MTYPLDVSDGAHGAGVLEVVGKHGDEVVRHAGDPLQLDIGLNEIGEGLGSLNSLLQQSLLTAHPNQARQCLKGSEINHWVFGEGKILMRIS